KALTAFAHAVQHDPADADSHFHLGSLLLARDKVEAALPELQQAVNLALRMAHYHQGLGKALEAANRPDEAKAEYETMHRLAEDGLRALLAQNRLAEALTATTAAAAMEPKSASSLCEHGDCLAKLGRRDEAVAEFRSALLVEPR